MQVIMDAKLALDMGVPIYGVLAFQLPPPLTRLVAPFQLLAKAYSLLHESIHLSSRRHSLDLKYRKRQMDLRRKANQELARIRAHVPPGRSFCHEAARRSVSSETDYMEDRAAHIDREKPSDRRKKHSTGSGTISGSKTHASHPSVARSPPGALTIDDLSVASFHGTSTHGERQERV